MSFSGSQQNLQDRNNAGFLYAGNVKKLHKRQKKKYQARRLVVYPTKIDYYKPDSSHICGSMNLETARAEVSPFHKCTFEILYDDIKERQYVFMCQEEYERAIFLWVINGEQYNRFGATMRHLTKATLEFMEQYRCVPAVYKVIQKKFDHAAKHFLSISHEKSTSAKGDYEDPDSLGIFRKDALSEGCSSSESENDFYFENEKTNSTIKEEIPIPLNDDSGYMAASQVHSFKASTFSPKYKRILSRTTSADSTQSKFSNMGYSGGQTVVYNIPAGDKTIDFGARDVNAIKVKVSGQNDFIEVDMKYIGNTVVDFRRILCTELNICEDTISCIRKLPDVLVRNDEDVARIRAGRQFEIELMD